MEQEAGIDLDGDFPVVVPYFMREIIEQISIAARASKYIDQQSGVSARFSIANYRTMVASAGSAAPCWASSPPCRGSATWGISIARRWASWSWT